MKCTKCNRFELQLRQLLSKEHEQDPHVQLLSATDALSCGCTIVHFGNRVTRTL